MKVLIVEDEADVAALLESALSKEGYETRVVTTGEDAVVAFGEEEFDLALLDVALPGIDGFEVLSQVRDKVDVPVLMLTARQRVQDRVKGLKLGADDYLIKPFDLDELFARTQAIMRRSKQGRGVIELGDLWIDPIARRARRRGRNLYFSNTEFSLLILLASNPSTPISKQEILQKVWDEVDYRDPNLVEVYIGYLRHKLEVNGMPRLIQTIRGTGYMLTPVEEAA